MLTLMGCGPRSGGPETAKADANDRSTVGATAVGTALGAPVVPSAVAPTSSSALGAASPSRPTSKAPVSALAVAVQSCALHTDGAVSCWGHGFGPSPVRFDGFEGAIQIAASGRNVCARMANGDVLCTGAGDEDALTVPPLAAVRISLARPAISIAGECALSADGVVACWDLGTEPRKAHEIADLVGAVRISSIYGRGCAIDRNDQVSCWSQGKVFRRLKAKLRDVEELAVGSDDYACARHRDGSVSCWGTEPVPPVRLTKAVPFRVVEPTRLAGIRDAVSLTAAAGQMCATKRDGHVACWIANFKAKPETVAGITDAVDVATGDTRACARTASGGVSCWGDNSYGALGIGLARYRTKPEAVENIDDAIAVHVRDDYSCALRRGGMVSCWGKLELMNEHHPQTRAREVAGLRSVVEIGGGIGLCVRYDDGTIACHDGPDRTHVAKPIAIPAASAFDAGLFGCAVTNGTVNCWGSNRYGEFGNGTRGEDGKPARVASGASGIDDAAALAVGSFHTCLVRKNGSVVTFGDDLGDDALGDGPGRLVMSPRDVPMPAPATSVAAGLEHCCAALRDGRVACFGGNKRGALGDGTTMRRASPVLVPGLEHVTKITSAYETTCALADGKVYCWGANGAGQVGPLGTSKSVLLPVLVPGLPEIVDVSTGSHHTCAVARGGAVFCWGSTSYGQSGVVASAERREAVPLTFGR